MRDILEEIPTDSLKLVVMEACILRKEMISYSVAMNAVLKVELYSQSFLQVALKFSFTQ